MRTPVNTPAGLWCGRGSEVALIALLAALTTAPPLHAYPVTVAVAMAPAPAAVAAKATLIQVARAPLASADSAAAVRAAISAQRTFERLRLFYMPHGSLGTGSGCDERVGRFCYSYGDRSKPSPEPPPERREVGEARRTLIDRLDSLARHAAGDPWVVGSLVQYQLEDSDTAAALNSALRCGADAWWCSALRGLVHHRSGRHVNAEEAFDAARSLMGAQRRCEWDDISQLLPDSAARIYRAEPCERRLELSANAWWLARPLISAPGNHRRSEHDARRVMVELATRGVNPAWLSWGDDMAELTIRFGWPQYYSRYWSVYGNPADQSYRISQYHPEPSYNLIPTFDAILNPHAAPESAWSILPEWSNEEYSPLPLTLANLTRQSGRFLRGDSMLVVTHASTGDDFAFEGVDSVDFLAAVSGSRLERTHVSRFTGRPEGHSFEMRIPNAAALVGIEVGNGENHFARARSALAPIERTSSGHAISDILILNPGDAALLSLNEARARMLAGISIPRNAGFSMYWECYGVSSGDRIDVTVAAEPVERSFLRRIGEALRIVSGDGGSRVSWTEQGMLDNGVMSRSLSLQTASLRPGRYTLTLVVRINDAPPVTTKRVMEITR